ncbi:MAG: lytic murein transglycosylase [Microbacterium sp.]|uniref:lytic murein transglycosylase n=1 Tax=Microbacterium sp. TaxID=51671 RepID=UPI001ACEC16A|nr:lytic murein transglycosylase [Microbacterium sp.]MBN9177980.1 lytic murein transglycosylase [Microbacterium sp.]
MNDEFTRLLVPDPSLGGAVAARRPRRRAAALSGVLVIAALATFAGALWASWPGEHPPDSATGVPAGTDASTESSPTPLPVVSRAPGAQAVSALADPAWVRRTAARTGIPPRALAAYAGAALRIQRVHPGCGLGWNTLAAIGEVESAHGTIFGGAIGADGVARPRIIGIPLDGTSSLAVADTDGGVLDGDPIWDRALGPMQFIPDTWTRDGRDGDGDGRADVDSIDDAALTAADYLCRAGGDLTDPSSWIRAVDAYNPSVDYNHRVAEAADAYAALAG